MLLDSLKYGLNNIRQFNAGRSSLSVTDNVLIQNDNFSSFKKILIKYKGIH